MLDKTGIYKGKAYCSANCANSACSKNVLNINYVHFGFSDKPLYVIDYKKDCEIFIPSAMDNFKRLNIKEKPN